MHRDIMYLMSYSNSLFKMVHKHSFTPAWLCMWHSLSWNSLPSLSTWRSLIVYNSSNVILYFNFTGPLANAIHILLPYHLIYVFYKNLSSQINWRGISQMPSVLQYSAPQSPPFNFTVSLLTPASQPASLVTTSLEQPSLSLSPGPSSLSLIKQRPLFY